MKSTFARTNSITLLMFLFFMILSPHVSFSMENDDTKKLRQDEKLERNRLLCSDYLSNMNSNPFFTILLPYLNVKDILKLRQTSLHFEKLLYPDDENYTINYIGNPFKSFETNLQWPNIKYFKNYSLDALQSKNHFEVGTCHHVVVQNSSNDNEYISWPNDSVHDRKWEMAKQGNLKRKRVTKNQEFVKYDPSIANSKFDFIGFPPREMRNRVKNAKMIISNKGASVALMEDGSLLSWHLLPGFSQITQLLVGIENMYGENIPKEVKDVQIVFSNASSFVTISKKGEVMGWGMQGKIPEELRFGLEPKVKMIFSTEDSFTALRNDYTLIQWGYEDWENVHEIPHELQGNKNIKKIISNDAAYVALTNDGNVFTWGFGYSAVIPPDLKPRMKNNVKSIIKTKFAFTALLKDNTAVSWGNIVNPIEELVNIKKIVATKEDFMALFEDGKILTWGENNDGSEFETIGCLASDIFSTPKRFAAAIYGSHFQTNERNAVIFWYEFGVNNGKIRSQICNVPELLQGVFSDKYGFSVLYGSPSNLQVKKFRDP